MDSVTSIKSSIDKLKEVFDIDLGEMRRRLEYLEALKGGGGNSDELKRLTRRLDEMEASSKRLPIDVSRYSGGSWPDEGFDSKAAFVMAVAFDKGDSRIDNLRTKAASIATTGSASLGGVLIPTSWRMELLEYFASQSLVRPRARHIPNDPQHPEADIKLPACDYTAGRQLGVTAGFYLEDAEIPESEPPSFRELTLSAYEMGARATFSDRLLRNTAALEVVVRDTLEDAAATVQEWSFWNGSGINEPTGVMQHDCSIEVERTTPSAVKFEDVIAMFSRVIPRSANRYAWFAHPSILPELLSMVLAGSTSAPIWQPNLAAGTPGTLLGLPLLLREGAPALGSYADLALCCFDYYLLRDGLGFTLDASQHVNDNFARGPTTLRLRCSLDAEPLLTAPWQLEDEASTASPFIFLGGRSGS